ncbi:hypothetical protein E2C01_093347 [Portunus trituberculatus]|uniref:Uncharacterized protein n=1 Tax=Portunus trituberculatus TaxID=210409 RepID=A0A5B7JYB3_PORTR|nr:hypothetical protein [Portunus trituberculatus]
MVTRIVWAQSIEVDGMPRHRNTPYCSRYDPLLWIRTTKKQPRRKMNKKAAQKDHSYDGVHESVVLHSRVNTVIYRIRESLVYVCE